jgi:hypothetical protein
MTGVLIKMPRGAGGIAQVLGHLLSKHKVLGSKPSTGKKKTKQNRERGHVTTEDRITTRSWES